MIKKVGNPQEAHLSVTQALLTRKIVIPLETEMTAFVTIIIIIDCTLKDTLMAEK